MTRQELFMILDVLVPGIDGGSGDQLANICDKSDSYWLSDQVGCRGLDNAYSDGVEIFGLLDLSGQVLIDLGAADPKNVYRFACRNKAAGYIAVEPLNADLTEEWYLSIRNRGKITVPCVWVPEDALTFLRRLPVRSVSIIACGMDHWIIPAGTYRTAIGAEIERTLHPQGYYLDYESGLQVNSLKTEHRTSTSGSVGRICTLS